MEEMELQVASLSAENQKLQRSADLVQVRICIHCIIIKMINY